VNGDGAAGSSSSSSNELDCTGVSSRPVRATVARGKVERAYVGGSASAFLAASSEASSLTRSS
jgi:hypothetical protein